MENIINIECTDTTYLCNTRPNNNFNTDENLLIGLINNNFQNYSLFKSILQFSIPNLNPSLVKNIYLYLYLENLHHTTKNSTIGISLSANADVIDISSINWSTCPKRNINASINVNVPTQSIQKYITIDITNIIKSSNPSTNVCNVIIELLNFNSSSIIQLASNNSENPPYLVLVNSEIDAETPADSYESNNNNDAKDNKSDIENNEESELKNDDKNYGDKLNPEDFSTKIVNELNAKNLKLDELEKNLLNLISEKNSSSDILGTLTSNLNELIKIEIDNLKNFVNTDVSELKSSSNQNISALNDSINNLNELIKTEIYELKDSIEKLVNQKISSIDSSAKLNFDSTGMLKEEIDSLRNSVSNDISEIHAYVSSSVSNLNDSIKGLNETMLQLSHKISKISDIISDVIIDPINDKSIQ